MPSDDTSRMGGQPPLRQSPNEEDPDEAMGAGERPGNASPPPAVPQAPMERYLPRAAKTEVLFKPPQVMAWLAVRSGPRAGRLYRLSADVAAIGRDSLNDFILDDPVVSRNHAKVRLGRGQEGKEQFYIRDLGSANGTLVNSKRIVKEALYDGDEIEIGRTVLVFRQMDGPRRAHGARIDETGSAEDGLDGDDSATAVLGFV